jgi:peptidylprolyl isomerase
MKHLFLLATLPLAFSAPIIAQETSAPVTPDDVVAAAAAEEWVEIAAEDLLVMDLAPDAAGKPRRVVIQLMPAPFSQPWLENIRTLARAHWWDGTSVYRAVDNWVVQWGDVSEERALPEGVESSKHCYKLEEFSDACPAGELDAAILGLGALAEDTEPYADWRSRDAYAEWVDLIWGWPVALSQDGNTRNWELWPIHCYGSVGVARDLAPDTGTGSELYAVIGHAPRQLDRNIAVVGRVIDGMEHLSTLRRGTGDAGVYETREEDTPILQVRMASELHEIPQPRFEYLSTESESFARYVEVRANRDDAFYTVPAGGVDICNVPVPIRQIPGD